MASPPLNFSINVVPGNLQGLNTLLNQSQAFQRALTNIDTSSRRTFLTLEDLGQRYQRTGFMGRQDQQSLERATQQWQRTSQVLSLQRTQASAELARIQAAGVIGPADRRAEARAQARVDQYTRQFRGMAELERSYVFDPGFQPMMVPPSGPFTPWAPPGQPQPPTPPQPPGPPAPPTPPPRPGVGRYAAQAALGLVHQGGALGRIAAAAGGGALFGAVAGGVGAVPGAIISGGVAAASEIINKGTEAMGAWSQRARSVLQVGQLLDQNFGAITAQVVALNKEFDVLSQDSLAAMEAMSRVTGRRDEAGLRSAVGFGVAYGMAPPHAAAVAGTLSMLGTGADPLRRVAAGARAAFGTGALPMRMDVLQDEAAQIAAIGGTAAVPMDADFYGRQVGSISGMGQRYRMPGAASGYAERLAQGLSQAPDAAVLMMRYRAVDALMRERVAKGLGTTLTIGTGEGRETVDLASEEGRRIAMEQAPQSPEIRKAYVDITKREFGFNPELQAQAFERIYAGGALGPTEARRERLRQDRGGGSARPAPPSGPAAVAPPAAQEPGGGPPRTMAPAGPAAVAPPAAQEPGGGPPRLLTPAGPAAAFEAAPQVAGGGPPRLLVPAGPPAVATEAAIEAGREARRREAPEALPGRVEARWQDLMENLPIAVAAAQKALQAQLTTIEAVTKTEQATREGLGAVKEAITTYGAQIVNLLTQHHDAPTGEQSWWPGPSGGTMAEFGANLWGSVLDALTRHSDPTAGTPAVQPQRPSGR